MRDVEQWRERQRYPPQGREFRTISYEISESFEREPFERSGLWLVRPDGYVALATRHDQWDEIAKYLEVLTKGTGR